MRRRQYLMSLAAVGFTSGCLGGGGANEPTTVPENAGGGTPTPSPTATATPTATQTPEASLAPIDEPSLKTAILEAIFEARGSTLRTEGTLARRLDEMAVYHSDRMAESRTVVQEIDSESTADRFEMFGINCRFRDDDGKYMYQYEDYEIVGSTSTRGVTVEEAANGLVGKWLEDPEASETLLLKNAETIGLGVTIVTGRAFVTLVYC